MPGVNQVDHGKDLCLQLNAKMFSNALIGEGRSMEIETERPWGFRVESEVTISHSASASKQLVGFQSPHGVFAIVQK